MPRLIFCSNRQCLKPHQDPSLPPRRQIVAVHQGSMFYLRHQKMEAYIQAPFTVVCPRCGTPTQVSEQDALVPA